MIRTLILLTTLFLSSCSFSGNEGQTKPQITRCWIVKKYNDEKHSDSSVLLHLNLNKDGSVYKISVIESTCGKLNKYECDKFVNHAIKVVHISSPIKNLLVDQYEDWKEINLLFDPSNER
jgi:hypothetical protein